MSGTARRVWWSEFAATEFPPPDPAAAIAVVPLAAVEQHGPHLPVGTDSLIAAGMLDAAIAQLPTDLDVRILPLQSVGKSNEHLYAPGTLTLPATALVALWTELGLSVARAGVGKIVFVNSHGGNEEIMGIVARELRVRAGMLAVKTSWTRFGMPDGLVDDEERRLGIHGGEVETALMLHFRPDLVAMERARDFRSATADDEARHALLRPQGTHAYAWIARDLNPAGVVGNAARGTADAGRRIAAHQAAGFAELLADIRRAALPPEFGRPVPAPGL